MPRRNRRVLPLFPPQDQRSGHKVPATVGGIPPSSRRGPRTGPGRLGRVSVKMKAVTAGVGFAMSRPTELSARSSRMYSYGIRQCHALCSSSGCRSGSRSAWSRPCSSRRWWCSGRPAPRSWPGAPPVGGQGPARPGGQRPRRRGRQFIAQAGEFLGIPRRARSRRARPQAFDRGHRRASPTARASRAATGQAGSRASSAPFS